MTTVAVLSELVADASGAPVARDCPVCRARSGRLLHDNAMVGIDRFGFGYPVVGCDACGTVHAACVLASDALADYYRTLSKYDEGGAPSSLDAHRARLAAGFTVRVAGRDAHLLDVGCATGTFLVEARSFGMARISGIEPAPAAVAVARLRHALDVEVGDANTFERFADYDVVTLLAVLEHLADPRAFVVRLADALRRDALLIVEVPDADAFGDYATPGIATEPFGEFSIEHINFFGEAALAALGRIAGLSIVAVERTRYLNGAGGIFVAFRNDGRGEHPPVDAAITAGAVARYVERCEAAMRDVDRRLATIDAPVVVYGGGSHTARLLARRSGQALDVRAIVDRNANLAGRSMGGVAISLPEAIGRHRGLPVVVSTFNAIEPIAAFVGRAFDNAVVRLYGEAP